MSYLNWIVAFGAAMAMAGCASTPAHQGDWSVSRSTDPVTGLERCVVAAVDRFGSDRLSRMGSLYPFVEKNSAIGLLVGVSSGGRFRVPPGDILWRVDANAFQELKISDTPTTGTSLTPAVPAPAQVQGSPEAEKAFQDAMAMSKRLVAAMTSGVTAASGTRAEELLTELRAGHTLIFRSATAAPSMGLPSDQTNRVGMITNDGLRPFQLDASFAAGLAACGIR